MRLALAIAAPLAALRAWGGGVKSGDMKKKVPWSRNDKLGAAGVAVALLAIGVGLLFPEVRRFLRLEKPAPVALAPAQIPKPELPATATPNATPPKTQPTPHTTTKGRVHNPSAPAPSQPPPMSQECAPGASCAQSSGQQGGITAGTVNIGPVPPPPRTLTDKQITNLGEIAADSKETALISILTTNTRDAINYGTAIYNALAKKARSKLEPGGAKTAILGFTTPTGTVVCTQSLDSPTISSAKQLATVLASNSPVQVLLSPCTNIKKDEIRLVIGAP